MDRNDDRRGDRSLDSDWHTREFTSQMYGTGRADRPRFQDQPSERDRVSRDQQQGSEYDRSHYRNQDYRDSSYGTPANSGRQGYSSPGEGNPMWGARDAEVGRGDRGRDEGGTQGVGRDGAQGYGMYYDQNRNVSGREISNDNRENQRRYGIQGGGYGVYDIGGQGARGYHRLANNTYDDMDFGTRHWGQGEYRGGERRDDRSLMEKVGEKVGETVGRFFGKGPKGYKRSDERIREDVSEALYIHHDIDATDIEVNVKDGVVTLEGTVDSRQTKRMAEDAVERVSGVQDVINHLRTKQSSNLSNANSEMGYPSVTDNRSSSDRDETFRH